MSDSHSSRSEQPYDVALVRHPRSDGDAVRGLRVRVIKGFGDTLTMTYTLDADLERVRVPELRAPRIGDRLWEHTCFEIFVRREGVRGYHEFNFAPSGEWAAYAFERYREGVPLVNEALYPRLAVRRSAGTLQLDASIDLDGLSPAHARAELRLGLAAVIEDDAGGLTYWALAHPADVPDFHHPDSFALVIT